MNSGSWSAVMPWPIIGIHAALLPDGRVLTFGSDEHGEQGAKDLRHLGSQDRGCTSLRQTRFRPTSSARPRSSTRSPAI